MDLVKVRTAVRAITAQVIMDSDIAKAGLLPRPTSGAAIEAARNWENPMKPEPAPTPISRTSSIPRAVALPKISAIIGTVRKSSSQVTQRVGPRSALTVSREAVPSIVLNAKRMIARGGKRRTSQLLNTDITVSIAALEAKTTEYI